MEIKVELAVGDRHHPIADERYVNNGRQHTLPVQWISVRRLVAIDGEDVTGEEMILEECVRANHGEMNST